MLISHRLKFNFVFAIILSASHGKSTELPEQGLSKGWRNLVLRGQSKGWRNQSSGRTTTIVAINMSHFDSVPMGPLEPILEVSEAFRADTDASKLNLAVRSYRIEELEPYVLGVVKYPHIEGLTAFNKITAELFLGTDHPVIQQKRVARVQSLSGSGSFCLASAFIQRYFPDAQAMISSPTWVSRKNIFDDVGVPSSEYRYYEPKTVRLDFDEMTSANGITAKRTWGPEPHQGNVAPDGSFIVLHGCAHNPTGIDPTHQQWEKIADVIQEKKHIPFFDVSYQAVPLYLSEMVPAHLRGGLNMMFQLATTLGIVTANMINYGTEKIKPLGWRLSLGLAAVPAVLMTVGGFLLPETPNNLIEQGLKVEGRITLGKIRGTRDVDAEFQDMIEASELANSIKHPFRNILEPRNRPQLVMAIFMPMFQILTGINSKLFYAPVLFQSMGFGGHASLYNSVLTGVVLALSMLVSIATVYKWGRRALLIGGGIQMIICQIIVAIILGLKFGNGQELSKDYSILVVFVICLFVAAFGWSWGPLGWAIPSEIFPLETRSAGQSRTVSVNLFVFVIAQAFRSLLCAFKFGIFLFAGWITIMTIFVFIFLPETEGIPLEGVALLWRKHSFWKKIMPPILVTDVRDSGKSPVVDA